MSIPHTVIISFEDILPVWKNELWPSRSSKISPMSSMAYLGGYDMSIYNKYTPTFYGVYIDKLLVGVNSCHKTEDMVLRSRGLFVNPAFRGNGIGNMLLHAVIQQHISERCAILWSLARKESLSVYYNAGFVVSTGEEIITETGTNLYVKLKDIQ
jgi:GNAT superfamily N-acetyltransferase